MDRATKRDMRGVRRLVRGEQSLTFTEKGALSRDFSERKKLPRTAD